MSSSCGTDAGKTALRGEYMATRTTIPAQVKLSSDARIQLLLESFDLYRDAPLVLTYVSYDSEVDTRQIMAAAWAAGKSVAVPKCVPADKTLRFYRIDSFDDLEPGFKDILEPVDDPERLLHAKDMVGSVCLVPALVYDADGHRIGYGGGYYDRFLSFYPGDKLGLARTTQLSSNPLPHEDHDVPVDVIVTETCVWTCR